MKLRSKAAVVGLTSIPFIVATVYLLATRGVFHWFSAISDVIAVFISLFLGVFCIAATLWSDRTRAIAVLVYVPIYAVVLSGYMLVFVCTVFGDCL